MTDSEKLYHEIAVEIPDITLGKMFGALCLKAPNGKAGVMLWKEFMIFKLEATDQAEALSLEGAHIFTPMDGRPMNGWVQLSYHHAAKWKRYAQLAMEHVKTIPATAKPKKK